MPHGLAQRPLRRPIPLARHALGDEVYVTLRGMIVRGALEPDARITETEIAQLLGVSRTPVREAFQRLEYEGWLITRPGHSARVAPLTIKKVQEVYPLIAVLEGLAARLALRWLTEADLRHMEELTKKMAQHARRGETEQLLAADAEFHSVLHVRSQNDRLRQIVADLRGRMERLEFAFFSDPEAVHGSLARHRKLVRVLRRREPALAQSALERQWDLGRQALLEIIRKRKMVPEREPGKDLAKAASK